MHHYVFVNGIQLHYVKEGSGPLIVLLHGFPEFWYSWHHQIPVLAKTHTVVAVDMRGYNDSDKPPGVSAYKASTVATDIKKLIQALDFKTAIIVGHDWGGGIAWQFARQYPEFTDKLIVMNCPPGEVLVKHLFTNFSQFHKSWYMFFFQLPGIPEWYLSRKVHKFFKNALRGWSVNKNAFTEADINKYVDAFSKPGAFTAPLNYYRAAFREPFASSKLKPVQADTLLIWGEQDKALGKELTIDIPKYVQGSYQVKYIPNSGHYVQNDAPELVNQYMLEFLNAEKPANA
jgi:pimeloyl-ACP methyl ester carboxylesterase